MSIACHIIQPCIPSIPFLSSLHISSVSILIIIPLFVPPLIIRILHIVTKLLHTFRHVIPLVLDILWYIFHSLHLLASPLRCVLREVFHILDAVIPLLLDVVSKVLGASDLLAGPARGVFREVADIVAEFVDAVGDVGFGAVPAIFCEGVLEMM